MYFSRNNVVHKYQKVFVMLNDDHKTRRFKTYDFMLDSTQFIKCITIYIYIYRERERNRYYLYLNRKMSFKHFLLPFLI